MLQVLPESCLCTQSQGKKQSSVQLAGSKANAMLICLLHKLILSFLKQDVAMSVCVAYVVTDNAQYMIGL